jgi:hypothetical protein
LSNINVSIGALQQSGHKDVADQLKALTDAIASSKLSDGDKRDALEHIDVLASEAKKPPTERKKAIAAGSGAFLEKALTNTANLATVWLIGWPVIKGFFGIA